MKSKLISKYTTDTDTGTLDIEFYSDDLDKVEITPFYNDSVVSLNDEFNFLKVTIKFSSHYEDEANSIVIVATAEEENISYQRKINAKEFADMVIRPSIDLRTEFNDVETFKEIKEDMAQHVYDLIFNEKGIGYSNAILNGVGVVKSGNHSIATFEGISFKDKKTITLHQMTGNVDITRIKDPTIIFKSVLNKANEVIKFSNFSSIKETNNATGVFINKTVFFFGNADPNYDLSTRFSSNELEKVPFKNSLNDDRLYEARSAYLAKEDVEEEDPFDDLVF